MRLKLLKKYGESKTINLFNLALGDKKEELKLKINLILGLMEL